MKRRLLSAAIFTLLIALSVWSIRRIDSLYEDISSLLDEAEAYAQTDDLDSALALSVQALDIWLEADDYTHIFLRHPEIDGTSDAFYELLSAIAEGDAEALPPAFSKLRYHLDSITSMEHVKLGSVL